MASPELHIKDCYYFEVPKLLWPSARKSIADFPAVWIKNDSQFQDWEADRLCERLAGMGTKDLPPADKLKDEYQQWKHHGHENFGKPMSAFLMEKREDLRGRFSAWQRTAGKDGGRTTFEEWLKQSSQGAEPYVWFARQMEDPKWAEKWQAACRSAADVDAFRREPQVNWAPQKIDAYNYHLHGKILIPQPFGELRNLYQAESGFCVSKFMIIEVLVGLVILLAFAWLGRRVLAGGVPQGRLWNFLESLLVFVRDEVARKAIHSHHAEESHGHGHGHGESGHGHSGHGEGGHGGSGHGHGQSNPHAEADKFVPILWTLFLFILGCNLAGMLPWLGSPTGSWSVTLAMALVTFGTGFLCGSRRFGVLGYWANQVPSMGLPFALAVILVPMIFLIEVLGLAIKHTVLSVRLLANMVAGHLVLLAIMALAFSVQGAMSSSWTITAFFALLGATALSCLELFVALLQAYVFTFLSALFINAAINKH